MVKVAIVEDQKELRENLKTIIELLGEVELLFTAENGKDCISKLNEQKPDVILMDIEMPGMNGLDATKEIKQIHPEISIVMLTAFDQKENVFKALQNGANGYLLKGERPKAIVDAIIQANEGRLPMTPEIAIKTLSFFNQIDENLKAKEDFGLTKRESEILQHLCNGLSYKLIADSCFISERTVNTHIDNIYRKLNVHSAMEASNVAKKNNWF